MGELIAILVIIGIFNSLFSNKKKKQKAGQKRAATAQPKQRPQPRPRQPAQQRIPFSKEEWKAYMHELSDELISEKAAMQPAHAAHDEGEGFISNQGESIEEHAEHRRRIAEEEARHHQEREALSELRNANLEKLRTAVIMSEVLSKPVSLRPRTGYHR